MIKQLNRLIDNRLQSNSKNTQFKKLIKKRTNTTPTIKLTNISK